MIRAHRPIACALAALCLLVVAACGGSGDKQPSGAAGVLSEAFGPDKPVKSGDVDAALTFTSTGLSGVSGPVKLDLAGPFQSQGGGDLPFFDFDLGLTAGGTKLTAGAISTAARGFLKFQGAAYALPSAIYTQFKQGYQESVKAATDGEKSSSGGSLRTLGIDPLHWLSAPKTVGTEQVGGVATDHVSATVDVPKLLGDVDRLLRKAGSLTGAAAQAAAGVPKGLTQAQRTLIADAITGTSFDVWAGKDDGTLRRLDLAVSFRLPAVAQAAAGGLKSGKVALTVTIGALNRKQTISVPSTTRPFAELQTQLTQLIAGIFGGGAAAPSTGTGSGSGSGAGTGSGTSGAGSGTATPENDYDACMSAAGADIAKVNKCAPLLNP